MNDLNNVIIIGRLCKDAELKYTQSGIAISNFSIANNRKFGEKESVSYFDCTLWSKGAEVLSPYLLKGKKIAVKGRLEQQRWESDGGKRSKVVINVDQVQFLDVKKSEASDADVRTDSAHVQEIPDNPFGEDSSEIPF
jgi:single-strand DNA-binding protein